MTRRDGLKMMVALGFFSGARSVWAAPGPALVLVFDGRFEQARLLARGASQAYDCASDAAGLWYRRLHEHAGSSSRITGLTTGADAMVLADCASRVGLILERLASPGALNGLIRWQLLPHPSAGLSGHFPTVTNGRPS